jgi:protoporphyrin/coproporphyrin ferrochelatase
VPASKAPRVAVVLFNLGGPDTPEAIRPFLRNLFRDPAILRVPFFIRPFLARIIARSRLAPATANYALLGGRSPLLELTRQQAAALQQALPAGLDVRCLIAMRYWHPFSEEAVREAKAWGPDRIVLLPLYPQYSTTTTGSSLTAWREAAARCGLVAETTALCCYFDNPHFASAIAALLGASYAQARAVLDPAIRLRVLFSAHGLPVAIVRAGDPYQYQIEQSVHAVLRVWGVADVEWRIAYQSRATPQQWLTPSTVDEIENAAKDKVALLVVPIAFVSEHSETLVELDVEYRHLAERLGVPGYFRAPTPNTDAAFIRTLAELVTEGLAQGPGVRSHMGRRACPLQHRNCPMTCTDSQPQ